MFVCTHTLSFYDRQPVCEGFHLVIAICGMIKKNESDVGDVVFEILAKTVFKFLCFILF